MALTIVTVPATEPLSLAEVREHLRLESEEGDVSVLNALIKAARQVVEGLTERVLITQTWDWFMDAFPAGDLEVPYPPLQAGAEITSIKYYDTAGVEQTWAASNYSLDTDSVPGRISRAYGVSYPSTRPMNNAVTVRFVAGYGLASAVPQPIKQAMLILVAHWYGQRELVSTEAGVTPTEVPLMVTTLLADYSKVTL